MPIPSGARFKHYRGSKEKLKRKNAREIETARRIFKDFMRRLADNPNDVQVHYFASIATDLGVTAEEVRAAISNGGYNGITVRVDEHDRTILERYKTPSGDVS